MRRVYKSTVEYVHQFDDGDSEVISSMRKCVYSST